MWVMWPIMTEHPRAASEYSRPIATLVEQLVWTVWKGNDVKRAAWLNAVKLPAGVAEREALFPPQGNAAFKFCSGWRRKQHPQVASSCTPKLLSAKVQRSFGGSVDWDLHGSFDTSWTQPLPPDPHAQPRFYPWQGNPVAHFASTRCCKCDVNWWV